MDKRPMIAGPKLARALSRLSRNALIDVLVTMTEYEGLQHGEDTSDRVLAAMIQPWADRVAKVRDEPRIDLEAEMRRSEEREKFASFVGKLMEQPDA